MHVVLYIAYVAYDCSYGWCTACCHFSCAILVVLSHANLVSICQSPSPPVEAQEGQRVVVHYVAKYRNITFMTSRQGAGVTGGTPLGFQIGAKIGGKTLEGLDLVCCCEVLLCGVVVWWCCVG